MAVVQISRIQQRRGLQQDLPQLASAEFGWSVDTQQLYIGNGTIAEGAPAIGVTEILTQNSDLLNIAGAYSFRGTQSGYTSRTGPSADVPITRTLQEKADEFVSVRDFGAKGDGATDDSAAIQRAIDQVYFGNFSYSHSRLRRILRFPAGTYLINVSLKIPSFAYLEGEGKERSIIRQLNNLYPVIQLKDSQGRSDATYYSGDNNTSNPATNLTFVDLTLQNDYSQDVVHLDTTRDVEFVRVLFRGSKVASNTISGTQDAVYAIPVHSPTNVRPSLDNISFLECDFYNCDQALTVNGTNVRMAGCNFKQLSYGINVDTTLSTVGTRNIKILNSTFHNIAISGIYVNAANSVVATSVMSSMNHFGDVGTTLLGGGNPVYPVINFAGGSGNYSVADNFWRSDADNYVVPRIRSASRSTNVTFDSNSGVSLGMMSIGTGRTVTLAPNQNTATAVQLPTGTPAGTIEYWLRRDNSSYRRGTIDYIVNGSTVQYTDEYTEYPNATNFVYPGPTGITFSVAKSGSTAYLYYTSDNSGYGNVTYSITSFS